MRNRPWPVPALFLSLLFTSPLAEVGLEGAEARPGARGAGDREAQLLFNTASRLYREKSWSEAAQVFGDFLERFSRHPDAAEARFARGYCLGRLGRHQEAAADLAAALEREDAPWAAEASFHLGRSLEALAEKEPAGSEARRSRLRAAAESYGRASRLASRSKEAPEEDGGEAGEKGARGAPPAAGLKDLALASQGEALYKAGHFGEAVKVLDPLASGAGASGKPGKPARGLYTLALCHQALAKGEGGMGAEGSAGAREAHGAAARKLLVELSRPERADDPLWEESAFLLARLLHGGGDRRQAAERYAAVAAKGGPRAAEAAYYRAVALYESQTEADLAQAEKELSRFLEKDSGHTLAPRARLYEALCLFDGKRYGDAARKLAGLAAAGHEVSALASLRLGQSLLLKEPPEPRPALAALDRAIQVFSTSPSAAKDRAGDAGGQELFQAVYWKGEACLALGGDSLDRAAQAFSRVAEGGREADPALAEKALYQEARARFLQGDRKACALKARLYRERYPGGKGRYFLESLKLSGENGFRASLKDLDEEERGAVPGYYAGAAALEKDPAQGRRLLYLSGIALHERGKWREAAETLEKVHGEDRARPLADFREPELPFFLADALIRSPGEDAAGGGDRFRRAASLLEGFLEKGSGEARAPVALLDLGVCRERLGDPTGARRCFEKLLADHPGHSLTAEARIRLANAELALGDLEAASAEYLRASGEPGDPAAAARAGLQAAVLERRLGRPEKALETLSGLEKKLAEGSTGDEGRAILADVRSQEALATCDAARRRLDGGKPLQALKAIEPLLEGTAPEAAQDQALYLRAWCFEALSRKETGKEKDRCEEEMESSYRSLLEKHPRSGLAPDAMVELAERLFNRKAFPEAKKWFAVAREALEKKAAGTEGPGGSGSASGAGGRGQDGGRAADLLARALFGLGFAAFEEKDFSAARDLFDRAAARPAGGLTPRALFQSARAWMQSQGEKQAVERLEKLLADPSPLAAELREEALLRMGECRHRLGDFPGSISVLRKMLEEFPQGPLRQEGLFALGFASQLQKDHGAAVKAYRQVVAETDAVVAARAQYHLGECFMDEGKHREAAREFLTVAANFDFEGPYRDWVRRALLAAGMAYQAAGDHPTARKQYEELSRRFPDSEEGQAASKRLEEVK